MPGLDLKCAPDYATVAHILDPGFQKSKWIGAPSRPPCRSAQQKFGLRTSYLRPPYDEGANNFYRSLCFRPRHYRASLANDAGTFGAET